MIQLKENTLYTNKELAEWFGMKANSFANQKEKKVFVKKVYEPKKNKKGSESYQIIKANLEKYWSQNGKGLDTCKRVAGEMSRDNLVSSITIGTTENYTNRSKREKYGINYVSQGTVGTSVYSWGKYVQDGDDVKLVPLTQEEIEIKNKLVKKYFGNTTDKHVFVQGMVENGQITKEQAWEVLEELTNMKEKFKAFKADFEVAINSPVGRGTYLIETKKEESAF